MNARFVNVKVDREERPDVDAVYMDAVQAMTGRGGWPMTVFLTPDGEPFYGGTYFPKPAFGQLMAAITDAWRNRRDELDQNTTALREALSRTTWLRPADGVPGAAHLTQAVQSLAANFDAEWGGFGAAPKFPSTMSLDLVLAAHLQSGDPGAARDRHDVTRRDGVGRDVRPHRRRLRPVLRRPRVARAALREDALRPGAAAARLRPRRRRPGRATLAAGRRRDRRVRAARPAPVRWRVLVRRGRRLARPRRPRPRGPLPHLDRRRGGRRARRRRRRRPRALRHHRGWQLRGALDPQPPARPRRVRPPGRGRVGAPAPVRGARAAAPPRPRRQGAHRVERPHGLLARRSRRAARPAGLDRRRRAGCRLPSPRAAPARRALVAFVARRRRAEGAPRRAGGGPRLPGRRVHAAGRGHRGGALDRRGQVRGRHDARALLGQCQRRPLHDARRRRGARRPPEGPLRQRHAVGQLDRRRRPHPTGCAHRRAPGTPSTPTASCDWSAPSSTRPRRRSPTPCRRSPCATGGITEVAVVGDRPDLVDVVTERWRPSVVLAWGEPYESPLWESRVDGLAYVCRDYACQAPQDTPDGLRAQLAGV